MQLVKYKLTIKYKSGKQFSRTFDFFASASIFAKNAKKSKKYLSHKIEYVGR